ncbi:MAG: hypothetical protein IJS17_00835, partial [Clostridia bacterium]|nr:hypothetical protein [Clostridia bacterium]
MKSLKKILCFVMIFAIAATIIVGTTDKLDSSAYDVTVTVSTTSIDKSKATTFTATRSYNTYW